MRFSSYVIKVASRCNLNCDYCYMYKHVDQTWRDKPRLLSEKHRQLFVQRLKEYVQLKKLDRVLLVYHGGEPLLLGADTLVRWSAHIFEQLQEVGCRANFGIQTNGVLLKEEYLAAFEAHNISVSLSIDGPKEIHDHHRLDIKNQPTFDKVYAALQLLKKHPRVFTGCIAVIDPHFDPRLLFEFFHKVGVEEFNMLLPDANYITPPPGRDIHPTLYKDWLINAFDIWFDEFPHLRCKFFDDLLKAGVGQSLTTDYFGLGDISLLVLETDGSYHNHDVLKIAEENSSSLGLCLENDAIVQAESSEKILFHRHLLTKEGLSQKCQSCPHINICGGGFIAHRFSVVDGYKNPTIYCSEIYSLIDHIIQKVHRTLSNVQQEVPEFDALTMHEFWDAKTSIHLLGVLKEYRAKQNYSKLLNSLSYCLRTCSSRTQEIEKCKTLSFSASKEALLEPTVHAWIRAIHGQSLAAPMRNSDGVELPLDVDYFNDFYRIVHSCAKKSLTIQSTDRWFQLSLGSNIVLNHPQQVLERGIENLHKALHILQEYDADLYQELLYVNSHIQLVKDLKAHPDKDVSFSDESIPGALFLSVWTADGLLSPYAVTASLIHEHLHQKLYLLMNRFELFKDKTTMIYSPWPKVLRPPYGVLHAVYVFTFVAKFWSYAIKNNLVSQSFVYELENHLAFLKSCIQEIRQKVQFTPIGELFFSCVSNEYNSLVAETALAEV